MGTVFPEVNQEHSGKKVTSLKSSGERTHETRASLLLCVGIRVIHQSQRSRNLGFLVSCACEQQFHGSSHGTLPHVLPPLS